MALTTAEQKRVRKILDRLMASVRGQIFLANLNNASHLVDHALFAIALSRVPTAELRVMTEVSLLVEVRIAIQETTPGLMLKHPQSPLSQFSTDGRVLCTMTEDTYESRYRDVVTSSSGHGATLWKIGEVRRVFKRGAATRSGFWVAPINAFSDPVDPRSRAEVVRNRLGLVHYGAGVALVGMHLECKKAPPAIFRPTIVEATPNARFRQVDPAAPAEKRWGRTVDLALLAKTPLPADIGGLPEVVAEKMPLLNADSVEFYKLGETSSDQSTTTSDNEFLKHLLDGKKIQDVYSKLVQSLLP